MAYIGQAPTPLPLTATDIPDLPATKITSGTFPALNGSNLTNIDGGKVLQVVTGTLTSNASTTSNSYIASQLDVDITPSATSSKILVMYCLNNYAISSNTRTTQTLYRGSTDLGTGANGTLTGYTSGHHGYPLTSHLLDTPNTTSQIHYEVYIKTNSGTLWYGGHDSAGILSTITCLEIGA